MRPPICAICGSRFPAFKSEGGTVSFTLTAEEKERKQRMIDSRMVGHPPGLEWFCAEHIDQAKSLRHLSRGEALKTMRGPRKKHNSIKYRPATMADCDQIRDLIANSTRVLSHEHYSNAQIEGALKQAMGLDTQLIKDKTYITAERNGQLIACGGWSFRSTKFGNDSEANRDASEIDPNLGSAKIRAFFVHPEFTRKGIAKRLLKSCEIQARKRGYTKLELVSTLPGLKFYEQCGYIAGEPFDYPLENGLSMQFIPMSKEVEKMKPSVRRW